LEPLFKATTMESAASARTSSGMSVATQFAEGKRMSAGCSLSPLPRAL